MLIEVLLMLLVLGLLTTPKFKQLTNRRGVKKEEEQGQDGKY